MVNINMGERLKTLRTKRNWTQKQVANRLNLAISAISAYELGTRYPSYDILLKLARLYNVSTDYLIGKDEVRNIDVSGLSEDEINIVVQMVDILRKSRRM